MNSERFRRIRAVFERALALPLGQRESFLDAACKGDDELRREVQSLLDHDSGSTGEPFDEDAVPTRAYTAGGAKLPPIKPGEHRIGPYRVLRKIDEGGMGIVYEAERLAPMRLKVALKVIKHGLAGAQVLARFEAERQALAMMNHPNVAKVLDAGTDDNGQPYFAMEFIRGDPINEYCDRNRLSTKDRIELVIAVCEGVQHAHQKGIIHRDLSPSNVLVEIQDGRPVPRVIDFGIAKAIDRALTERTLYTEQGQILGKPEYMSPEQAEMTGVDIDTRTDVYSLGVMLYELLVGELPFSSHDLRKVGFDEMRRIIRQETPPRPSTRLTTQGEATTTIARDRRSNPSSLVKSCRGDLDWITMRALEKDRTRRYGSASDLAADLRRHLNNEPVLAGPPSAAYLARKFVRRHRVGVTTAALLIAAIVAGLVGTTYNMLRARRAEARARLEAATALRTTNFMRDMIAVNNPSESRGRSVTAYEILQNGVAEIETGLIEEPELRTRMLDLMGGIYRQLGLYEDAQRLLEEGLRESIRVHGESHVVTAMVLDRLAGLAVLRSDPDRALNHLARVQQIERDLRIGDTTDRAKTLVNLGAALRSAKRYEEAIEPLERAATIYERILGPEHQLLAKPLNNLGQCYTQLGEYEKAESYYKRALPIRQVELGGDHPATMNLRNSIAELQRKRGDYDLAITALRPLIEQQRDVLGPDHSDLVYSLANLGMAELAAGEKEAGRRHLEEALELGRRTLGSDAGIVRGLEGELAEQP